ncbi:oxalate decarboxylase [Microbacterium sp. AK009]|uniref:cupin domain-containing protein n=1 Tax=Microbacterium sp. AK009 TaxID=2723068 RepID=UPI0015CBA2CF|nr:cupin domain-containing protein [Microbacterium sp. AK009]NYF16139.1 oxalate decarboxylase [Microbacterium sp. AK009]
MTSPHVASLHIAPPVFEGEAGEIRRLTRADFPMLRRMSIQRIVLAPGGVREPQWNVNAHQLAYVTRGRVLVSVLGNADSFASFVVIAGQMFHIESGAVHHIENVGDGPAEIIAALRSGHPEHFSFAGSVGAMTDAVLGNTYDLEAKAFEILPRRDPTPIFRRRGAAQIPDSAGLPNARLFDAEGQQAPLSYSYGFAKLARRQYWAALENISMYHLHIAGTGMREPHWHPVTAELGYVWKGRGRMRVLGPDGTLAQYELEPGQVYFIPRAFPHHIETLGEDGLDFLIFFDQPTPGDIGYRATGSAFSREVLAGSFGIPERDLPPLPYTPVDPLIVERGNPRDP